MTQYTGKTFDQVVADLGQPARISSFKMGQPLDEMRAPLLNVFPLNKAGNEEVKIREAVWAEGEYYITVWFHEVGDNWLVVDGVRWHKDVRF